MAAKLRDRDSAGTTLSGGTHPAARSRERHPTPMLLGRIAFSRVPARTYGGFPSVDPVADFSVGRLILLCSLICCPTAMKRGEPRGDSHASPPGRTVEIARAH